MTPGTLYDRESYNCSHVVADYYQQRLGVTIPQGSPSDWGLAFIRWMRRNFHTSAVPVQDCLILVRQVGGSLHVGVWDDGLMLHGHSDGQVIRSPLALVRGDITFWVYNGND